MRFVAFLLTISVSLSVFEPAFGHGAGHPQPANPVNTGGGSAAAQTITKSENFLSGSGEFFNQQPAQDSSGQYRLNEPEDRNPSGTVVLPRQPRDSMFGN